jgi:uncharacterized damage-inducible protein DinB
VPADKRRVVVDALLVALDEAFDRRAWHGTNLRGSIRGMDARTAAWRPAPGRHSIHELVVHAAYWKYAVRRRLTGEKRGSFALEGSNWFPRAGADAAQWARDVRLLVDEHRLLRAAIERVTDAALDRPAPGHGTQTPGQLIRGIAAHDLYHAGQIQVLKRLRPKSVDGDR